MATRCQRFIQYGVFAICTRDFIIIGTRLEGAFQELGVLENERIGNLSRGEYFRVQLALGLAHQADIFLLDEAGLEMESGYPGKSI